MSEFNFKSAVCTSRSQSKRLLALGLKPETADCHWAYHSVTATRYVVAHPCDGVGECIPAWSLHRLIEMALRDILICGISFTFNEDAYEKVIRIIEHQIKEGYFKKEYLQEQADSSREEKR